MSTYVLVHGSYQGGWIWQLVARPLEDAGHRVFRPTLDGSAERRRNVGAGLTLEQHGAELADLLFYEDLKEVVLVGTSIGGMVVAEAAPLVADRIKRLVFIDALVPLPGESVPVINSRAPHDVRNVVYGPSPDQAAETIFAELPEDVRAWAAARYTQQAIAPTDDPVDLRAFWERSWPVDVLRCTRSPLPPAAHQKRTAERLQGTYDELDAGHYPMLSHPEAIAKYLLQRS